MAQADPSQLESSIKRLPGVLGCVVLANPDGSPAEVQAFTRAGADRESIEGAILDEARSRGLSGGLGQVFIFELEAESSFGDRESLERAAEMAEQEARSKGPLGVLHALGTLHSLAESAPDEPVKTPTERVPFRRVRVSSSSWSSEAEVILGGEKREVTGTASGEKSAHGLTVVAEATLQAAAQIVPDRAFELVDIALVSPLEREAVLVLVREEGTSEMLGAALVRSTPVTEAAVRATLDAVNRRLSPPD
jgi:hypothetical protein